MHTCVIHLASISSQVEQFHSSALTASVSSTTFHQWRGWKNMTKANKKIYHSSICQLKGFFPHKTATIRLKGGWVKELCATVYQWKTARLKSESKTETLVRRLFLWSVCCDQLQKSKHVSSSSLKITNPWNPLAKLTSHTYAQGRRVLHTQKAGVSYNQSLLWWSTSRSVRTNIRSARLVAPMRLNTAKTVKQSRLSPPISIFKVSYK